METDTEIRLFEFTARVLFHFRSKLLSLRTELEAKVDSLLEAGGSPWLDQSLHVTSQGKLRSVEDRMERGPY